MRSLMRGWFFSSSSPLHFLLLRCWKVQHCVQIRLPSMNKGHVKNRVCFCFQISEVRKSHLIPDQPSVLIHCLCPSAFGRGKRHLSRRIGIKSHSMARLRLQPTNQRKCLCAGGKMERIIYFSFDFKRQRGFRFYYHELPCDQWLFSWIYVLA